MLSRINLPDLFEVSEIITLFQVKLDSNTRYPNKPYNFWILGYVESGVYYYTQKGRQYALGPGSFYFRAPGQILEKNRDTSVCTVCQISFRTKGCEIDYFRDKIFLPTLHTNDLAQRLFGLGRKLLYWNGEVCGDSGMSVYPDTKNTELYEVKLTLQLLLNTLCTQDVRQPESAKSQATQRDVFSRAVVYMHEHLQSPICLTELAQAIGVSESLLQKTFSAKCGTGVMKYYGSVRLEEAKKLLQAGSSIAQAAETLGFSSASYFSRWFKKETGIAPLKYRAI